MRKLKAIYKQIKEKGILQFISRVFYVLHRQIFISVIDRGVIWIKQPKFKIRDKTIMLDLPSHSVKESRILWDNYDWREDGEEWTRDVKKYKRLDPARWKSSLINEMMLRYIKSGSKILEIGPGAGRWTEALQKLAKRLIIADISKKCLSLCRERFKKNNNIEYRLIEGRLDFIKDDSIDYIWAYDVFVHINPTDVERYIEDFRRILKPGGCALIHHAGTYSRENIRKEASRSYMNGKTFASLVKKYGMEMLEQNDTLVHVPGDIISVLRKPFQRQKTFSVSIIVCTYNREKILPYCLQSLNQQKFPENNAEILVIDNASTDNTKKIVSSFLKTSKFKCRYILERKQGLSAAKNRGIKEATGDFIAFIDDDAVACKNWIKNLVNCFSKEEILAAGGKTIPKFEVKPPEWLPPKYLFVLGAVDLGQKIKIVPYIAGGNSAFRKKIFQQVGFFRTDLGRKKKSLLSGEELDLCQRISQAGGKIIYNPKAIIYHLAPKERLAKNFFCERLFNEGISQAIMDKKGVGFGKRLRRLFFHRPKSVCIALFWFLVFSLRKDEKESFSYWGDLLLSLGYLYKAFSLI